MDSHICLCFQDIMRYCLDYVKKMPHTGMSAWNFIGYGEDFVFYSECNGKPLMGFKQRNYSDMILVFRGLCWLLSGEGIIRD